MRPALVVAVLVGAAVLVAPRPARLVQRAPRSRARRRGSALARGEGSGGAGREAVTSSEVASALALLALAYRSGLATWDVLDAVAAGVGPAPAADLRQVGAALRWGATDADAWASVGPAWTPAARAVTVAHLAGVAPGPLLVAAAHELHESETERVEVAAARVGVRLVAPLGLVLLPAFCLTTVVPLVVALAADLVSR